VRRRLPLILSATALLVSLFGATPLGNAAEKALRSVPPFAKKAAYADKAGLALNANRLNGHKSSTTPVAGNIPVLGPDGKLPASIGAVGPPGQSATKLWAVVHTDGANASLIRGSGATAATQGGGPGYVNVTFNQNVSSCAYLVTTGLDNFDLPARGGATADRDPADPSKVYVQTFDMTGTAKALDFFLAVFCQ
jgi:hypothetical protein